MCEPVRNPACHSAPDAWHLGRGTRSHRTHWPAAEYLSATRVRSDGTLGIVPTTAGFPAFSKSADRNLVEGAQ